MNKNLRQFYTVKLVGNAIYIDAKEGYTKEYFDNYNEILKEVTCKKLTYDK